MSADVLAARLTSDVTGSGVFSETAAVSAPFLGLRYYLPRSTYGGTVRPFLGAGVAPVIGSQFADRIGTTVTLEARTEAAIGGELGGGVDFLLGRHFLLSLAIGFAGLSDFGQPIGGSDNYSGPQLALGFSYVFGG